MLKKTKAIVLHYVKYSESSIIAHCYSEEYGRIGLMVNGITKKRSLFKLNAFQPLNFVELDMYYKEKSSLHRIKDLKTIKSAYSFQVDFIKNAITLFIAELLYKTLKEQAGDKALFNFLLHALSYLDEMEEGKANFHILFLIELSKYYGFYPHSENSGTYFNYQTGIFTNTKDYACAEKTISDLIRTFTSTRFEDLHTIKLNKNTRGEIMDELLKMYRYHMEGTRQLESIAILKNLFS